MIYGQTENRLSHDCSQTVCFHPSTHPSTRGAAPTENTFNLFKYLLRGIDEVYDQGSDAESKHEHHLEKKKGKTSTFSKGGRSIN